MLSRNSQSEVYRNCRTVGRMVARDVSLPIRHRQDHARGAGRHNMRWRQQDVHSAVPSDPASASTGRRCRTEICGTAKMQEMRPCRRPVQLPLPDYIRRYGLGFACALRIVLKCRADGCGCTRSAQTGGGVAWCEACLRLKIYLPHPILPPTIQLISVPDQNPWALLPMAKWEFLPMALTFPDEY